MNHIALDWTRTNDGNLDHQIIEFSWSKTRQHVHLCAAFHLEHAEGIGIAEHVVNRGVFLGNRCQFVTVAPMQMNEIKSLANAGQHTK